MHVVPLVISGPQAAELVKQRDHLLDIIAIDSKSAAMLGVAAGDPPIEPHGMSQIAVRLMAQAGVDIASQWSKHLDELKDIPFDYVRHGL